MAGRNLATRLAGAAAADALIVVLFAAVGRRSHDESGGIASALGTAAPFLCALAVAWVGAVALCRARHRDESQLLGVDAGVLIALATVAVGMLARRLLWDDGTALAFVVVTAAFFTSLMGGWRAVWARVHNRRSRPSSATP
jgi:hypothetical protein